MQDILKVIRFDFLTMRPVSMGESVFVVLFCLMLSILLSPLIAVMITFCVFGFIYPLQAIADKNGFDRLYGTLPVDRRNVTRARFIYIFTLFFIFEAIELFIVLVSVSVKLNKHIFDIGSSAQRSRQLLTYMQTIYDSPVPVYVTVFIVTALCCTAAAYMEMAGQLHGRENLFRSVIIGIAALAAILGGVYLLSVNTAIIPAFSAEEAMSLIIGMTVRDAIVLGAAANAAMLTVCLVFGEITVRIVSEREI